MSWTNFPNGVTSFGLPVFGSPAMSVEAAYGGEIFFVSDRGSDGNDGKGVNTPFLTITKALSMCTSTNGSWIFLGEGRWKEQVVITKRGIHLIGMGPYQTQIQAPDAGTSAMTAFDGYYPIIGAATLSTGGSHSSQGGEIANLRVGGNGGYPGIYLGDSNTSGNVSGYQVHDCLIDGSNQEGTYGLLLYGGSFVKVWNNIISSWKNGGIYISSGQTRTTYGNIFCNNYIIKCRGTGITLTGTCNCNLILSNAIMDDNTALTTGILGTGSTGADNLVAGNWLGTTGTLINLVTGDHCSGNFKRSAGDAATCVEEE